jgi:hypothetical protein
MSLFITSFIYIYYCYKEDVPKVTLPKNDIKIVSKGTVSQHLFGK